jgi:hypothetical protein
VEALVARWFGKEIASDYSSDSNPTSGYYSNSSCEFDFGSDPIEPKSEINTTEEPLSGSATSYKIYSCRKILLLARSQARRPDRRQLMLRCLRRLTSLPEGNTAGPNRGAYVNRGASTDSGLGTPNHQVFMATGETAGPSGTRLD